MDAGYFDHTWGCLPFGEKHDGLQIDTGCAQLDGSILQYDIVNELKSVNELVLEAHLEVHDL